MATTTVQQSSPTAFFVVPPVLQSWVNILFFSWRCESAPRVFFFFFKYSSYYCILMFQLDFCLVNYFIVLLLGVVSLMTESTTGVLMSPGYSLWWIPKHDAAVLLCNKNIRHDQLLHRGPQVLHHQGTRVLHNYKCRASILHRGS
jgi:hypothetical protein